MDRLLFGDNQFFGVNHMSEEKARAQAMRFQRLDAVIDVLDAAYEEGIRTFMCTTHDRVGEVCDHVRANPERYPDFAFYPVHAVRAQVRQRGHRARHDRRAAQVPARRGAARRGHARRRRRWPSKDIEGIITLLIDAEMKMFDGPAARRSMFLQNVVTDLLLGLGFNDAFRIFADHVATRYGAEPGFITMNLPRAARRARRARHREPDRLRQHQQDRLPHVRRHRRPTRRRCASSRFRPIAMSVFASGAIPPREAIEWVCAQPNIESIVFGASSARNIRQTRDLVARHWDLEPVLA